MNIKKTIVSSAGIASGTLCFAGNANGRLAMIPSNKRTPLLRMYIPTIELNSGCIVHMKCGFYTVRTNSLVLGEERCMMNIGNHDKSHDANRCLQELK